MRKYIYTLAAIFALAACDREAAQTDPAREIDWSRAKFVVDATAEDGAQTRALKTEWKDGDEILVLFGGTRERFLMLEYDEAAQEWTRNSTIANLDGLDPDGGDAVSAIHSSVGIDSDIDNLSVGTNGDLLYTDGGSYTADVTDPDAPVVHLTLALHRAATTAVIMRTPADEQNIDRWRLWGDGLSKQTGATLLSEGAAFTNFDEHVRAMFTPSTSTNWTLPDAAYLPDGKVVFHVMSTLGADDPVTFSVVKDENINGTVDPEETVYTRTFTGRELTAGATVEFDGPTMPDAIAPGKWDVAGNTPDQPTSWDDVQSAVDAMNDGDVLDLSALPQFPDNDPDAEEITITVAKNITITAQMDPVSGKFGDGTSYNPFHNIYFELADDATLTLDKASFNVSTDPKPLISGNGNVIVKNSSIFHLVPIDITGDVTVYGTIARLLSGNRNFTTEIGSTQSDAPFVAPKSGISARNVTINGGTVAGGTAFVPDGTAKGGTAIVASGDVTITGEMVEIDGGKYESVYILGGYGKYGSDGGDAIMVAGKLTVTGATAIHGGN